MGVQHKTLALLAALLAGGCGAAAGTGEQRAEVVFQDNCAPCHGVQGHGDEVLEAPAIAGLPAWYVEAQLQKFRKGHRGAHADDISGLRMRPMSRSIAETDITPIAGYVSSLSPKPGAIAALGGGDAANGKALYGTCAACHGPDGKGMEALAAPPIVQLDGWYVKAQIHKFKGGVRGALPGDTSGATMAPMAATLKDDQAILDVIAHLATLAN